MSDLSPVEQRIARRSGIADQVQLERLICAVLAKFGERLPSNMRANIAPMLPSGWQELLGEHAFSGEFEPDMLFRKVAALTHLPVGEAMEGTQVVLQELGAELPAETYAALAAVLGPTYAAILAPPDYAEALPPRAKQPTGRTLAEGRPGSDRPISEAAPRGAQRDSVATANPHGQDKISSAQARVERPGSTLANANEPEG